MNEVRQTIERIGSKFKPPEDVLETVTSRNRKRSSRLIGPALIGLFTLVPLSAVAWAVLSAPPDCPPVGEGEYKLVIDPQSGSAGTEAVLRGPVPLFNEEGNYQGTDDSMDFWWNVAQDQWIAAMPGGESPRAEGQGSAVHLGTEKLGDSCEFEFKFQVPDSPSGTYSIIGLQIGGGGGTLYDDVSFDVER
jgi:hypothetical protein